jgi:hypothetical protein
MLLGFAAHATAHAAYQLRLREKAAAADAVASQTGERIIQSTTNASVAVNNISSAILLPQQQQQQQKQQQQEQKPQQQQLLLRSPLVVSSKSLSHSIAIAIGTPEGEEAVVAAFKRGKSITRVGAHRG